MCVSASRALAVCARARACIFPTTPCRPRLPPLSIVLARPRIAVVCRSWLLCPCRRFTICLFPISNPSHSDTRYLIHVSHTHTHTHTSTGTRDLSSLSLAVRLPATTTPPPRRRSWGEARIRTGLVSGALTEKALALIFCLPGHPALGSACQRRMPDTQLRKVLLTTESMTQYMIVSSTRSA